MVVVGVRGGGMQCQGCQDETLLLRRVRRLIRRTREECVRSLMGQNLRLQLPKG